MKKTISSKNQRSEIYVGRTQTGTGGEMCIFCTSRKVHFDDGKYDRSKGGQTIKDNFQQVEKCVYFVHLVN